MTSVSSVRNMPLDKTKKRAYSLQARLKEIGYDFSLGHACEIIANVQGYRNWATMKSALDAVSHKFVLGYEADFSPNLNSSEFYGNLVPQANIKKPVELSLSQMMEPIEIVGKYDRHRTQATDQILFNAIRDRRPVIYLDGSSSKVRANEVRELFTKHGRGGDLLAWDFTTADASRFFTASLEKLKSEELVDIFHGCLEPDFFLGKGSTGAMWSERSKFFLKGLLGVMTWLRDNKKQALTSEALIEHASVKGLLRLFFERADIPEKQLQPLRVFLSSIPYFDFDKKYDQRTLTLDQIGYLSMTVARLVANLASRRSDDNDENDGSPDLSLTLEDALKAGKSVFVRLPSVIEEHAGDNDENMARFCYFSMIAAIRNVEGAKPKDYLMSVVDCFDAALPHDLDATLHDISSKPACLLFGWTKSPVLSCLKRGTSVHVDNIEGQTTLTISSPSEVLESVIPAI